VNYRFAYGPNKGKKALTLKTVPEQDHASTHGLVVKNSGFSLHAGVAVHAQDKAKLERLCRYIARPAVALERLSLNQRGQVVYTLKKPYDDGTTHIVMAPLELIERLAALVPRPRVHLTRFHGVLAPHYKHRKQIVPNPTTDLADPATADANLSESPQQTAQAKNSRMSWARLLKRVFGLDVEVCELCSGKTKIIAAIEDPPVIKKILKHLGLSHTPPEIYPARGPPAPIADEGQAFTLDFDQPP
jgi:hypothetical protein